MWLGTIAHSFLPSHIAAKHTRHKAQLRRAHGLRPADTDARVAPMPWQLCPAAPPGASSGVRRRPDRRGRSPGCSSDPPPNAPKSQNAAQGSRPAGAPASPPRPASRVPPPPRCPPAIRRRSDRRSRSLGCSAAANARVCARAWTGNSRQVAACSVGWCGAGAATGIGGVAGHLSPTIFGARTRRLSTQKPDFPSRRTRATARESQDNNRQAHAARRPRPGQPPADLLRRMRGRGATLVAHRVQTTERTTRLPGTEPERQRIATRGAHLASAPERRGRSTPRRDTKPCRLRTAPVKSAVVALSTA